MDTPPGIKTLDLALSRDDRKRLFDAGYKATTDFLANLEPLKRVKMAGDQLQKQLQAEFGPPQYFTPVLHALAKDIEAKTSAKSVRAQIMLPTGRPEPTRIVTYHFGMEGSTDIDLELLEKAGCSGRAWSQRAPILADLAGADKDPSWGMTAEQHAKVSSGPPVDAKRANSQPPSSWRHPTSGASRHTFRGFDHAAGRNRLAGNDIRWTSHSR